MKAKPIYKEEIEQVYTAGPAAAGRSKSRYIKEEDGEPTSDYQMAKEAAKLCLEVGLNDVVYIQRWKGEELAKEYELKAGFYTITSRSHGKTEEPRDNYPGEELGAFRTYEKAEAEARQLIRQQSRAVLFVQKWTSYGGQFITEYAIRTKDPISEKEHRAILEKYQAKGDPAAEILAELEEIHLSNQRIEDRKKRQAEKEKEE